MPEKCLLYAEDEEDDVLLLRITLRRAGITNPLRVINNGEEAIAYLKGAGRYADRLEYPLPGLVLLDLHMPLFSGLEVLQWIRRQRRFASLPVVIFTSAAHPRDVARARQLGVSDYLLKPPDAENMLLLVRRLKEQWLEQG